MNSALRKARNILEFGDLEEGMNRISLTKKDESGFLICRHMKTEHRVQMRSLKFILFDDFDGFDSESDRRYFGIESCIDEI